MTASSLVGSRSHTTVLVGMCVLRIVVAWPLIVETSGSNVSDSGRTLERRTWFLHVEFRFEFAPLVEFGQDVAATHELAVDERLWNRLPATV